MTTREIFRQYNLSLIVTNEKFYFNPKFNPNHEEYQKPIQVLQMV